MPLVSPRDILLPAFRAGRLVGAFNTGNLEMTRGILWAAEELRSPILLQVAEKRLPTSPLALLGPLMVAAARSASVPVAVQLDHGESPAVIAEALAYGFTGVMFDGSALPLEENIVRTAAIRPKGNSVWLEGEIGVLSGSEGGPEAEALHSDPAQAEAFAKSSGCDALAVSIGNAHGHYRGKPKLNFGILEEIRRRLPETPLVLHGGSGIPKEDLARAARLGICKVNIATASFDALYQSATTQAGRGGDYFSLSAAMAEAVYESTKRQILWFAEGSGPGAP
ncbi:MAG: class II fructose-bisphosphate aldolase [Oscillospiraceae bacterium]|jgi:fructose-bisphosphate aldolase class II|nr:class II fructose-bisphosphate aldolase [Oscillospiraceae bacterium]